MRRCNDLQLEARKVAECHEYGNTFQVTSPVHLYIMIEAAIDIQGCGQHSLAHIDRHLHGVGIYNW